jgi:hypothetical protein
MQDHLVQLKASVPRLLKRQAFAVLALREERFNRWLQTQLETLLHDESERNLAAVQDETVEVSRG